MIEQLLIAMGGSVLLWCAWAGLQLVLRDPSTVTRSGAVTACAAGCATGCTVHPTVDRTGTGGAMACAGSCPLTQPAAEPQNQPSRPPRAGAFSTEEDIVL